MNKDNLNNVRREASRHFRNKKREYLKDNKNIRDLYRSIYELRKGYQPRTNLIKDEKDDILTDPHKILNRWMNYFCQLLNV
jgi:hypothetical protein